MDLGEPVREVEIVPDEDPVKRITREREPAKEPTPAPRREEPVPA
jgi:hypothetical protein